jgi:predicted neuraminidase
MRLACIAIAVAARPAAAQSRSDADSGIIATREFIYTNAPFASAHASTIVETPSGALVAAWFGGAHEGSDDVEIWYSRKQAGDRWSAPAVATQTPDMPTWGPVVYLPAGLSGPIRTKPIILSDGTWLAGTSVEAGYRGDTPDDAPYRAWTVWVERSVDRGQSWTRSGPIGMPGEPYGVIQPTLWQTPSGEVRMLMRSTERIGRIAFAYSRDGGQTWSDARPTQLPNPNAGIDVVRLRDGRLILVYNHLPRGRSAIHLALSRDEGATWSAPLVLEDGQSELSYPAVIQSSDGLVHVTYTWQRTHIRHLVIDPRNMGGGD